MSTPVELVSSLLPHHKKLQAAAITQFLATNSITSTVTVTGTSKNKNSTNLKLADFQFTSENLSPHILARLTELVTELIHDPNKNITKKKEIVDFLRAVSSNNTNTSKNNNSNSTSKMELGKTPTPLTPRDTNNFTDSHSYDRSVNRTIEPSINQNLPFNYTTNRSYNLTSFVDDSPINGLRTTSFASGDFTKIGDHSSFANSKISKNLPPRQNSSKSFSNSNLLKNENHRSNSNYQHNQNNQNNQNNSTHQKSTLPYLSEAQLCKEILFVMRGIDQTHIKRSANEDAYRLTADAHINPRHVNALYSLAEMGWLHDKIYYYQQSAQQARARYGKTGQALGYRIHQELKRYYECLSVLDQSASFDPNVSISQQNQNLVQNCSLFTLATRTCTIRNRLKSLALIIDNCGTKKGSALLSILAEFTQLGDPQIQSLAKELFHAAVQPFLQMVQIWLNEGSLTDAYGEFFIAEGRNLDASKAEKFWNEAFEMKKSHIPSFISEELCREMLNAGKSVNFLRTICRENSFATSTTAQRRFFGNKEKYALKDVIPDEIHRNYYRASSALLRCLREKYDLNLHLVVWVFKKNGQKFYF